MFQCDELNSFHLLAISFGIHGIQDLRRRKDNWKPKLDDFKTHIWKWLVLLYPSFFFG